MSTNETSIINEAKKQWRRKLYEQLYQRKLNEVGSYEEDNDSEINLKHLSVREVVTAYKESLGISEQAIKKDLDENKKKRKEDASENESFEDE